MTKTPLKSVGFFIGFVLAPFGLMGAKLGNPLKRIAKVVAVSVAALRNPLTRITKVVAVLTAAVAIVVVVALGIHTIATMSLRGLVALAVLIYICNNIADGFAAFVK